MYGRRPYGVGFLVGGYDETGPHLFEFSPSGVTYEYFAMAIGARSQSAKTYLERHYESFPDCSLDELIMHGLNALRDTLQQDKDLTTLNTSIATIGPGSISAILSSALLAQNPPPPSTKNPSDTNDKLTFQPVSVTPAKDGAKYAAEKFKIVEGDDLSGFLERLPPKEGGAPTLSASEGNDAMDSSAADSGPSDAPAPGASGAMETD